MKNHLGNYCCILAGLFAMLACGQTFGQTTLHPGDIAVIGMNSDETVPNQKWAFVTLVPLLSGTAINFTDAGYDGSTGQFRTGAQAGNEGYMTYTVPADVAAGAVFFCTNTTINGSTTGISGQIGGPVNGFNNFGDQIIVYQGPSGVASSATFIYALNTGQNTTYGTNGGWVTSGSVAVGDWLTYIPPGLNSTTTAALSSSTNNTSSGPGTLGTPNYGFDNMVYSGPTSGTQAELLAAISNPANWRGDNATAYNMVSGSGVLPNTFTITGATLPVKLLSYTLINKEGHALLQWQTTGEINASHFEVEYGPGGTQFATVANLPCRAAVNASASYSYESASLPAGTAYFRLVEYDKGGARTYFDVKSITISHSKALALKLYPSPATAELHADFTPGYFLDVQLVDNKGQVLQVKRIAGTDNAAHFSVSGCVPGTYYVRFIGKDSMVTERFLKVQ